MLIATLPPVHQEEVLKFLVESPNVGAVRYNTGADSPYSPRETLARIAELTRRYKKPLYVDLKAPQLRITEWATFPYGPIVLNHKIKVELPAKVYFRGDDVCNIKEVIDGNKLYVEPFPKYPVGRGQSVNIVSDKLEVEGYLIENDCEYALSACKLGINKFMLSFVESLDDTLEFEDFLEREADLSVVGDIEVVLKIESQKGVDFVKNIAPAVLKNYRLMAARDDLMIQIGLSNMPDALRAIIKKDSEAICASRLLMGLEHGAVSMSDLSDLEFMRGMGYKHFMLSDGLSRNHGKEAIKFWEEYSKKFKV